MPEPYYNMPLEARQQAVGSFWGFRSLAAVGVGFTLLCGLQCVLNVYLWRLNEPCGNLNVPTCNFTISRRDMEENLQQIFSAALRAELEKVKISGSVQRCGDTWCCFEISWIHKKGQQLLVVRWACGQAARKSKTLSINQGLDIVQLGGHWYLTE